MQLNMDAVNAFKKLRNKYATKVVYITESDLISMPHLSFKNHREYIAFKLKEEGVEVLRWNHNYDSLKGPNPELGVVYMAMDSVIQEGYEAHVLIGHNARYIGGETV